MNLKEKLRLLLKQAEDESIVLKDLLVEHLFQASIVKTGRFILNSGAISPIYVNVRDLAIHHSALALVVYMISEKIKEFGLTYDRVGWIPMGSIAIANMLAFTSERGTLTLRKEAKNHGLTGAKTVESLFDGETALIVDDVVETGQSILDAVEKYRHLGQIVTDAFVVVDRQLGAYEQLSAVGVKLHSLISLSEIADALNK